MPCEHFQDALVAAAASGIEPQGELRLHLDACASCRATFEREHALFSAIGQSVHATANAPIPPSLLPRVRAAVAEAPVPRGRWIPVLAFACAAAVLYVVYAGARPFRKIPFSPSKPDTVAAQVASPNPPQLAEDKPAHSREVSSSKTRRLPDLHTNALSIAKADGDVEVLVPPEEREAFARFLSHLQERKELALAYVRPAPEKPDALLPFRPVEIARLELKPLDGTEESSTK